MRLIPHREKSDVVKAAQYNPKQFRRNHEAPGLSDPPPPHTVNQWAVLGLVAAIGAVAYYGWPKEQHRPQSTAAPVDQASVPAPPPAQKPINVSEAGLPANGLVKVMRTATPGSTAYTVDIAGRSDGQHCAVRFEDWHGGEAVLSVFVRTKQSAGIELPAGKFRVKAACSRKWATGSKPASIATFTQPFVLPVHGTAVPFQLDDV